MKNPKRLNRVQREFLIKKGLDPSIHRVTKSLPDFYEFYNKVTGVNFILWR